jgi:hypothetical protein
MPFVIEYVLPAKSHKVHGYDSFSCHSKSYLEPRVYTIMHNHTGLHTFLMGTRPKLKLVSDPSPPLTHVSISPSISALLRPMSEYDGNQ